MCFDFCFALKLLIANLELEIMWEMGRKREEMKESCTDVLLNNGKEVTVDLSSSYRSLPLKGCHRINFMKSYRLGTYSLIFFVSGVAIIINMFRNELFINKIVNKL